MRQGRWQQVQVRISLCKCMLVGEKMTPWRPEEIWPRVEARKGGWASSERQGWQLEALSLAGWDGFGLYFESTGEHRSDMVTFSLWKDCCPEVWRITQGKSPAVPRPRLHQVSKVLLPPHKHFSSSDNPESDKVQNMFFHFFFNGFTFFICDHLLLACFGGEHSWPFEIIPEDSF